MISTTRMRRPSTRKKRVVRISYRRPLIKFMLINDVNGDSEMIDEE